MAPASSQDAAAVFDPLRPSLIRVAYRMLGSVADAEDVVQDAFLRWLGVDRDRARAGLFGADAAVGDQRLRCGVRRFPAARWPRRRPARTAPGVRVGPRALRRRLARRWTRESPGDPARRPRRAGARRSAC